MCIECCCGMPHHNLGHRYSRQFMTKAEKAKKLKSYAEELRKELTAIEEQIKEN